ncbi:small neutral amino acid transporter SnatA (MarC family) [Virgibacillus natechei]|uniref:Small neutral amino acid transporter SnatA (MarC family) n=1 Tax=Virgibacillus natechei TaxID=1216297 RepID=A0ABS4II30_9BACI|nr:hypothetical protein [Virgibacillus natechei]MBP1969981.1 small neutral amino acid transporter SnatA (MarC family) [Virgibacillus natechei]UZD13361.1 hypothetical protein OLD84_02025 [Virgibacillus natechei]
MMKTVCIGFLVLLSFAVSVFLLFSNIAIETSYGATEVILFSVPFAMCVVNSNLIIIPKLISFQSSYTRYKKGIESIFLSVTIILFILHLGLILLVTGIEVNLLYLIPVSVGIVLITTANTLPRFQLDPNKTKEYTKNSNQLWNIVIRPISLPLFIGGLIMLLCVFLPSNLMMTGFFLVLLCTLIVSFYMSYRANQSY